jgi:thiosulfate dehydrogenase (quinone) large subunit
VKPQIFKEFPSGKWPQKVTKMLVFDRTVTGANYVNMFVAFLESIKHVGHLYPVAVLRIFLGYIYFANALERLNGSFLEQPRLAATIMNNISNKNLGTWYQQILEGLVVPNWQFFAYTVVYLEFVIGVSFLLGFLVRPIAILGILLAWNAIFIGSPALVPMQQCFLAMFIVLMWIGAGRCLGFDYFFYKRHRGLWW